MKTTIKISQARLDCLVAQWKLSIGNVTATDSLLATYYAFLVNAFVVEKPLYGTMLGNEEAYSNRAVRIMTAVELDKTITLMFNVYGYTEAINKMSPSNPMPALIAELFKE